MLNPTQKEALLKGINPTRIAQRDGFNGKKLSYIEAWDVKAHLTRIFGFCNWSWTIHSSELMFETEANNRWTVCYKVDGTLTIGSVSYGGVAVGSAMGNRAEAHDNAVKNADSDAIKRAAINLGDQFGLSLYNNGSTKPVVMETLDGASE